KLPAADGSSAATPADLGKKLGAETGVSSISIDAINDQDIDLSFTVNPRTKSKMKLVNMKASERKFVKGVLKTFHKEAEPSLLEAIDADQKYLQIKMNADRMGKLLREPDKYIKKNVFDSIANQTHDFGKAVHSMLVTAFQKAV